MLMPIAEYWNSPIVIQLAAFGGVAVASWWLLEMFTSRKPRAEQRLDEYREPNSRKSDLLIDSKSPGAMSKVLGAAAPTLSKPMQSKSEEDVSKIRHKLNQAGFRTETAITTYWSMKTLGLCIGFVLAGGALLFTRGFSMDTLMYTVLIAGIMFYIPEIILWLITKSRKDNIFFGLPDALDLMVVCVEAGLGLDQAMRKVSEEMKKSYRVIAEEFALCNLQLQMGRARNDVLHDLGNRTGVDDLKQLAAILIQADKFGSSVGQALRVQSDSMRTRRSQMAEEKAAKTAVKLIFPLVLFIFPAIFIVLVGPAAITMVNELFPSMGG